jgi:hypothetical protein
MPLPKRMPIGMRIDLAAAILAGKYNKVGGTSTHLLKEITLRNRNKEWYENRDAGKYPWLEPSDDNPEEVDK